MDFSKPKLEVYLERIFGGSQTDLFLFGGSPGRLHPLALLQSDPLVRQSHYLQSMLRLSNNTVSVPSALIVRCIVSCTR